MPDGGATFDARGFVSARGWFTWRHLLKSWPWVLRYVFVPPQVVRAGLVGWLAYGSALLVPALCAFRVTGLFLPGATLLCWWESGLALLLAQTGFRWLMLEINDRVELRERTNGLPFRLFWAAFLLAETFSDVPQARLTGERARNRSYFLVRYAFLLAHYRINREPLRHLLRSCGRSLARRSLLGRRLPAGVVCLLRATSDWCYRTRDAELMREFLELGGFGDRAGLVAVLGYSETMPELGKWIDQLLGGEPADAQKKAAPEASP